MTKSELVKKLLSKYSNLYQKDVKRIVDLMFDEISAALVRGDRVELRGFGAFSTRSRKSRVARNPKTNEKVFLGERRVVYYRPGKELKDRVDNFSGDKSGGSAPSAPASGGGYSSGQFVPPSVTPKF